jgi:hypothetical protein
MHEHMCAVLCCAADAMSEDPLTSPDQHRQQQQQQPPDPLPVLGADWADELSAVAGCLQQLGLGAASEEAYTRVINRCGRARCANALCLVVQ